MYTGNCWPKEMERNMIGQKSTVRNSAFEGMRLLAMFMVVLGHCLLAAASDCAPLSTMDNIAWFLQALTTCAVNLFFLLTGYFLKSGDARRKYPAIWGKTIFYSLGIYLLCVVLGEEAFTVKNLVSYAFPVLMKPYWFMQTYLVLSLLLPYLATLLDNLTERRHLALCGILLVFFCLHQTFIPVTITLDTSLGYGIIWATVMCIVGNFLRRYGGKYVQRIPCAVYLLGYLLIACCIFCSNYLIVRFDIAQIVKVVNRRYFYAYNSLTVFAESLCLFCFFIKLSEKARYSPVINWLSASSLAVYLIGSHPLLMYATWSAIFDMSKFASKLAVFFTVAVLASAVVVCVCILIDKALTWVYRKIRPVRRYELP